MLEKVSWRISGLHPHIGRRSLNLFLKTGKVVLLDRQVHTGGDSTNIVTTSRITGRAGETPVDIMVSEEASLKRTPHGWRIVSIEWSAAPGRKEG